MLTILRPLSTSELLDRTFHLYKDRFVLFVAIAAIPELFVLGLQVLYANFALSSHPSSPGFASAAISWLDLVCLSISEGATVIAVSELHLGRRATVASSYRGMRGSMWRVVWISFAVAAIVGFGFVLLIIPGILWALKYALAIPVTVIEKTSLGDTTNRSSELTKGSRGRIFVVFLLVTLFGFIVSEAIDFAINRTVPWHIETAFTAAKFVLEGVSGFLTNSLVGPLLTIALTLLYYDERVRKEGFDLQLMMANLESAAALGTAVVSAT